MRKNFACIKSLFVAIPLLLILSFGCERVGIGPEPLPEFDWLIMGYRGNITTDKWLTSDSLALFRNDLYVKNGRYQRHNEETLNKILEWTIQEDGKKGLFISTKVKLDKTEPDLYLYRGQLGFYITDESRAKVKATEVKGWDTWYTAVGQELIQAFSIRVPQGQRLDFPSSSVRDGLDDPTALQVWQNRTRFNENGRAGNIPLSIYLRGNQWMLVNEFDETPFFPGGKFNGDSLGEAIPGQWLDLVIRMAPDEVDGVVEVYSRKHNEDNYTLTYEHKNKPFYGPIAARWYPSHIDTRVAMGLPSYGIYPSGRFVPNRVEKWLDKGITTVEVHHTEIRLLQFPRGEAPMEDILRVAEKRF